MTRRQGSRSSGRAGAVALAVAVLIGGAWFDAASARSKIKVLHTFCSKAACADGAGPSPSSPLLRDPSGNLFGITSAGGKTNAGTVFEEQNLGNDKWKFTTVYSFCPDQMSCPDGDNPSGRLVFGADGSLYGTASGGNEHNAGVIYRLTKGGRKWRSMTLHTFCQQANCPDGAFPGGLTYAGAAAGTAYDGVSPLYGSANFGGTHGQGGVIYSLTPDGNGNWDYTKVYSFCAQTNCADGNSPTGGIVVDADSTITGTTTLGGSHSDGILFRLSHHGGWDLSVLYNFCSQANCADGGSSTDPTVAADGTIFGTTGVGGANHQGTLYAFDPDTSQYSVLYDFCALEDCADGRIANGGLVIDAGGNLFGTTFDGGAHSNFDGTVYRLGQQFKSLYSFCSKTDCADGQSPASGLTPGESGQFFGATEIGSAHGNGLVFELKP